jgi:hypothetical protein
MLSTGPTGGVDQSDRLELSWCSCSVFVKWFACIRLGGVSLVQGELVCVHGELFVVFKLWFGGLRSLLQHSFVLDVSSRCPCLRGLRLVLFKRSFSLPFFSFWSLVGVSFYSFLFFFSLSGYYVCVLSMHASRGRLRTLCGSRTGGWSLPVWWVIDNIVWTDSWLSIAGAGCVLTGVGASEEQAWKVVAGETSWCGEDK